MPRPALRWWAAALVAGLGVPAGPARAGGIEYVAPGTVALGRGGAFAVRADDPLALGYNPAALSDLRDPQLLLNLHNAFYRSCVDREGAYGDQVTFINSTTTFGLTADYADTPFPQVCNSNDALNPGAWLAFAFQPTDRLGIGVGVLTPAAAGHLVYGDGEGATDDGELPSPARYMIVEQKAIVLHPTVGLGYRFSDLLSAGIAFQAGLAIIELRNMTLLNGGENPGEDARSTLSVHDYFVPAVIGSVQLSFDALGARGLEAAVFGRWSDAIRADGDADVDVKAFNESVARSKADDVSVVAPQPDHVGVGLRYAAGDRWDVEMDTVYILASQMDVIALDIPRIPDLVEDGLRTDLPHHWSDQLSLRLGGDYAALPGRLSLRAGAHYETSAVDGSYMALAFQPAQRLGLHGGLTVRLGAVDLSLAYAHIFQETVVVPLAAQGFPQVAKNDPVLVNAGTYESAYDVVSVGANLHFGR